MQAIILAAGMGKRLKELTANNTKCMVKVNEETLIERLLNILDEKQLSRIVMVVGYESEKLKKHIDDLSIKTPIVYVNNYIFDKTNNIYSLYLAKDYLISDDTLLFESDLIFGSDIIDLLINDRRENLAVVDKFASWMDGTCLEIDTEDKINNFVPGKYLKFKDKENYYKTVNIYKFSRGFSENTYIPFLEAYSKAMGNNEYYESVIKLISLLENCELRALRLSGQVWYEIDDVQDLDIAQILFAKTSELKYKALCSRYGGYWRFPNLLDYCYLVNPYYPPQKMIEELQSNFEVLLRQYPSGLNVNNLLAGKYFGIKREHICIGNGAAELIKVIMENHFDGRIGFVLPTFEEYPNRVETERRIIFKPKMQDFSYSVEELIDYYSKNKVNFIVIINPDNPTGHYIKKNELIKLILWCKKNAIGLLIDESFVDFVDTLETQENMTTEEISLINEDILSLYNELYVVKSISKSFGIPGLRLGVLASSNEKIISKIMKEVSIWNINSIAEFYMQIFEKYRKDYVVSINKLQRARKKFVEKLNLIGYLKVFSSQANYVMCELIDRNSEDLAIRLLEYNILVKDLTSKISDGKQYIRLAVRTEEENDYLIEQLKKL